MTKINLQVAVRTAMRLRLITENVIPEQQLQLPNTRFSKPESGIWIRESVNEGSEEPMSNVASREFAIVNYEVFCEAALGTDEADRAVEAIRSIFPVVGEGSVIINDDGQFAVVKSIDKPAGEISPSDSAWYRRLVAVTIEMYHS